jgi:NAD dependent epimerase/dehydratase family enzyme
MDEIDGELGGTESSVPAAWRFSIDVVKQWEKTFFAAPVTVTRKVALRTAMIMSAKSGGAFSMLLRLVRTGFGGAAAPGTQYMSWIHEADFVRAIDFLIAHAEMDGVVNVCSPFPIPNQDFMRDLRDAWGSQFGFDATEWMLEIGAFLLRTETELILKSRRVVPRRLLEAGFEFEFPEWQAAADELVARFTRPEEQP